MSRAVSSQFATARRSDAKAVDTNKTDALKTVSLQSRPEADHSTGVMLSPAGMFVNGTEASGDRQSEHHRQLAIAIRQRIESRLAGRIRDLSVRIVNGTVFLEGRCSTYYSKQLAQHAAIGVLEGEHLENVIEVEV